MRRWTGWLRWTGRCALSVVLGGALWGASGCDSPSGDGQLTPLEAPWPVGGELAFPVEEDSDSLRVVVDRGRLIELQGGVLRIDPGSVDLQVINRPRGPDGVIEGEDQARTAVSLWLRGRGSLRHVLPQWVLGPVTGGAQERWTVDLQPGEYLLSVTYGGESEARIRVGPP